VLEHAPVEGLEPVGREPHHTRGFPAALDLAEEVLACAALVLVVLAVAWGVLTRYVTAQPAPWAGEVAGMAFAWLVFLGSAAGFKRGMHASVDLLTARLPGMVRRSLEIVVDLAVLAFATYVVWLGLEFTNRNLDNPSPVLRLPMSITYLPVALCFASIGIRMAARIVSGMWRGGYPP
jgi:TRAP-type C4-dicarboxylate transport system permease small subunit